MYYVLLAYISSLNDPIWEFSKMKYSKLSIIAPINANDNDDLKAVITSSNVPDSIYVKSMNIVLKNESWCFTGVLW